VKIRRREAFVLAAALAVLSGCQKASQPAAGVWATVNGKDITST
jgi:hypothetical protein